MDELKQMLSNIIEKQRDIQQDLSSISKQIRQLEIAHKQMTERLNHTEAKLTSQSFLNMPIL